MLSETTLDLAEKFRQNWQTQYPYLSVDVKCENVRRQQAPWEAHTGFGGIANLPGLQGLSRVGNGKLGALLHSGEARGASAGVSGGLCHSLHELEDDSLTNLNWLQNLNLFSISQSQPPLSPSPTHHQMSSPSTNFPLSHNPMNHLNRIIPQYFESSSLYAEVAMNLEFMNDEASVHFFKMNNQLRPPFSDINLISMAIHSYNKMKVSFPEICQWIEETFPYYKSLPDDWKNGIKNHLTLSKCFQKVPRRKDELEKGGFWRFSNDFLNFLERNRLYKINTNNFDDKQEKSGESMLSENQFNYKFGKIINRKRNINTAMAQDENRNSAFRIPKKKYFFNQPLPNIDNTLYLEPPNDLKSCTSTESIFLQFHDNPRQSLGNISQISLATTSGNDSLASMSMTVLANADSSQFRHPNNMFTQNLLTTQINDVVTNTDSPCPEQVTEEEFLSGQAFNNNFLSLNAHPEHISSLVDTQTNFNSNDFNINDLSITGIGLKPPEWWNQSLSASQLSLSKFNCSFRSVTASNNEERVSPLCINIDEDHHGIWSSDLSNLAELDVLFGLS